MIKISYIIFLFCFFSNYAISQISIDEIKNDSDAVRFVQYYGDKNRKGWKNVGVDLSNVSSIKNLKGDDRRFTDSVTKRKWLRQDFNGDGRSDLIFCGRIYYNQLGVLAFITNGVDSITCTNLGSILSMTFPSTISEHTIEGDKILELGQFYKNNQMTDYKSAYEKDLLVFKYGGFIEYNPNKVRRIEFDSIVYRISSPWGYSFTPSKLWLYRDGSVKIFQSYYQKNDSLIIANRNKSILGITAIKEINNLLAYIEFEKLKSSFYLKNVSDLSTAYLEVYFNGRLKRIEDYGMSGMFGLGLLYYKLGAIMAGTN